MHLLPRSRDPRHLTRAAKRNIGADRIESNRPRATGRTRRRYRRLLYYTYSPIRTYSRTLRVPCPGSAFFPPRAHNSSRESVGAQWAHVCTHTYTIYVYRNARAGVHIYIYIVSRSLASISAQMFASDYTQCVYVQSRRRWRSGHVWRFMDCGRDWGVALICGVTAEFLACASSIYWLRAVKRWFFSFNCFSNIAARGAACIEVEMLSLLRLRAGIVRYARRNFSFSLIHFKFEGVGFIRVGVAFYGEVLNYS